MIKYYQFYISINFVIEGESYATLNTYRTTVPILNPMDLQLAPGKVPSRIMIFSSLCIMLALIASCYAGSYSILNSITGNAIVNLFLYILSTAVKKFTNSKVELTRFPKI